MTQARVGRLAGSVPGVRARLRVARLVSALALLTMLAALVPLPGAASHVVATVAGSFQSELGCPGDWQPDCDLSRMSDPENDELYTFTTSALPAGSYEFKVALDEAWTTSYPASNVPFTIPADGDAVTITYDATTNAVTVDVDAEVPPGPDDNVFWDGLGHDSQDTLYRVPFGAVPAGTPVIVRFRTFTNDVTSVTLRVYDTGLAQERLIPMERVATGVPCDDESLAWDCDFWQATIETSVIGTIYYRFIVTDGTTTVYYEDDSDVRDGGWGATYTSSPDWGWVITVHDPDFVEPIAWMDGAVVYQIFPDRFRNGNPANDPTPIPGNPRWSSDPRYAYPNGDPAAGVDPRWDQIVRMNWWELPEGYCRNYQGISDAQCPKRFPQPPTNAREQPRGRDYYGGDLAGVQEKLGYLKSLGVTVIYFNPIFWAGSNHRYDTRDYFIIDPYLGNLGTFTELAEAAEAQGIKIILDGVFNHMSSDSPYFDRYHNWDDAVWGVGACESVDSPYRHWFRFRVPAAGEPLACAPYTAGGESYYASWAGFDSLPQLSEHPDVQAFVFGNDDSVARYWLQQGADGWRLDVMQDKSIPFWEGFREQVKDVDPEAIIIGELWKKFDVLPYAQGNTADTTMNYRLRDAVIGLLAPGPYDGKGFPGSGQPISATEFVDRLESVREDYPDAFYYALMNLLDSHDTERLLWTLTPGQENRQEREFNAANVAEGKARQRLAALIQMTMPGAPTIYYGDEVAVTGDDDPDTRRTYPWADTANSGDRRNPAPTADQQMLAWYTSLTSTRASTTALVDGDLEFIYADDATGVVAWLRRAGDQIAIVAINASEQQRTVTIPVDELPANLTLRSIVGRGEARVRDGQLQLTLAALSGRVLVPSGRNIDLSAPTAPTGLTATANGLSIELSWARVSGAAGYNVYCSPVTGGGYQLVGSTGGSTTRFTWSGDGLISGQRYYCVVTALDRAGNESGYSNEASAVPAYTIDWANLQWPPTMTHTVSAAGTTDAIYGQVWIDGVTSEPGPTTGLIAQVGYGPVGSNPSSWDTWVAMTFNAQVGNNDEYVGTLQPMVPGTYWYVTRYSTNAGEDWTYGDLNGPFTSGLPDQPGILTVNPNADQTPPDAPANLQALNGGPNSVLLSWTASTASDLYGYLILRATTAGGPYTQVGTAAAADTSFTDTTVATGTTYWYVVVAIDDAANQSPPSNEASATPAARVVAVTFRVTVPAGTPPTATVAIAGNQPELCAWCNPHTVTLTNVGGNVWEITLNFMEGTLLEYKYTLGSWDTVEKDAACGEIGNRQVRVVGGSGGTQLVTDTVQNWRNVAPCGS